MKTSDKIFSDAEVIFLVLLMISDYRGWGNMNSGNLNFLHREMKFDRLLVVGWRTMPGSGGQHDGKLRREESRPTWNMRLRVWDSRQQANLSTACTISTKCRGFPGMVTYSDGSSNRVTVIIVETVSLLLLATCARSLAVQWPEVDSKLPTTATPPRVNSNKSIGSNLRLQHTINLTTCLQAYENLLIQSDRTD